MTTKNVDENTITQAVVGSFAGCTDTLGLSMLVTMLANRKPRGCTESTVFGPFYVEGAPDFENGADITGGAQGEPCWVSGAVRDLDGLPIAGATIDEF